PPGATLDNALASLATTHFPAPTGGLAPAMDAGLVTDTGLAREIDVVAATRGRAKFETRTGFTIFGVGQVDVAAQRWTTSEPFPGEGPNSWHVRLDLKTGEDIRRPST